LLAGVHANFLAEFFVVACAESTYRIAIDAFELASRVVIVKDIVGWIFLISANTISTLNNMNTIVLTIK
jgi:hypothetical protein